MVSLFKDRSTASVIWVLLLSLLVHCHFFITPPIVAAGHEDGFVSLFLARHINGLHPAALMGIYHLLVVSQGLQLNHLFNDQRMHSRPNYLTAMTYVLVTAMFKEWNQLTPALFANTLVIWLFAKTLRLYNNQNPKTLIFNMGLVVGLGVLLYHPTALLILVAMFALLVVRPFSIPELVVMFMGVLAPFYFLGVYLFLTDQFHHLLMFVPEWRLNLPNVAAPVLLTVSLGIIILVLLVGLFHWQNKNRRMVIQVRKNWAVLMMMLWVMIPLPFINKGAGIETLLLWTVPVSPFMANAFMDTKKDTIPNIIFWTLVVLAVLNNWELIKR